MVEQWVGVLCVCLGEGSWLKNMCLHENILYHFIHMGMRLLYCQSHSHTTNHLLPSPFPFQFPHLFYLSPSFSPLSLLSFSPLFLSSFSPLFLSLSLLSLSSLSLLSFSLYLSSLSPLSSLSLLSSHKTTRAML